MEWNTHTAKKVGGAMRRILVETEYNEVGLSSKIFNIGKIVKGEVKTFYAIFKLYP